MARRRWKSLISDSFVQLAVILSLLRTDLRVYLRQYSQYPEVQQALLGQSVGLHIVDNYHNNDLLPLPSSKYIDDTESTFHELHRFVGSSALFRQSPISTWLVTDTLAQTATVSAASSVDSVELSQQVCTIVSTLMFYVEFYVLYGPNADNSKGFLHVILFDALSL